jgi:DNA-binding transcriptional ArsR family regulator
MSSKRALIIELLRAYPGGLFGLELVQLSDGKLAHSTIDIHLSILEEDGLVVAEPVPADRLGDLPRARYRLTQKGTRNRSGADAVLLAVC